VTRLSALQVSREQFLAGLRSVGIVPGDLVYVASSLAGLGLMPDPVGDTLWALREAVGPAGTLVMPTFNFSFCEGAAFDRESTPSTCGVLTEAFRQQPGVVRTWAPPYHTVAVEGARASELGQIEALTSFGADSVFHALYNLGAKQLLIGAGYQEGVAHFHWLEERCQVPYRYWKKFEGEVVLNGQARHRAFFMFVRHLQYRNDANPLGLEFEQAGYVRTADVGVCRLRAFSLTDFRAFMEPRFIANPHLTVSASQPAPARIRSSPVKRIDHLAIVSRYARKIRKFLQQIDYRLAYEGLVAELGVNCQYFTGPDVTLEFVDPVRDGSRVEHHLDQNPTAPLHHIAFEVDSLEAGVAYFKEKGYVPLDGQIYLGPKPYQRVIFLNPIQTGGLLVELVAEDGRSQVAYGGAQ